MTDYSSLKRVPRSWLTQSNRDLEAAIANAEDGRYDLACFMAHQTAEKAVVAFLYHHGVEHVWGHALADLCADATAFDQSFEFLKSVAGLLDQHYMGARYPMTLPGGAPCEAYEALDSDRALEIARKVLESVEHRMGLR
jgi:HEPN domain-containing protein